MIGSTLKSIDNEVFDFLLERHYQHKKRGEPEKFLFVITSDSDRLERQCWLPGNDESVVVSFLALGGRRGGAVSTHRPGQPNPADSGIFA